MPSFTILIPSTANIFVNLFFKQLLPSSFLLSSEQRQKRSLTQDVTPFSHNLIFQYTNPLSFETDRHSVPLFL